MCLLWPISIYMSIRIVWGGILGGGDVEYQPNPNAGMPLHFAGLE